MPLLTVFTPAYNRADTLPRLYESLQRQTRRDFCWLVIDDGSVDNTAALVKSWQEEQTDFEITYVYKENGGLHTGYNEAIARLATPLAVCIDSDDYMPDDAVETIAKVWSRRGGSNVAGIVALDADTDGKVIGDPLPGQETINLIDLLTGKYPIQNGDRKLVIRSELYKEVAPMESFPGEKNFNPHYMHLQISQRYDFLVLNQVLCIVEYQPGGMTDGIYRQYLNSPRSFAQTRRLYLSFPDTSLAFRFRHCVHYVSSSILAKDRHFIKTSPRKFLTVLAILPGIALTAFVSRKAR